MKQTRSSCRLRAAEALEPRQLLASHPGFVYDANETLVPVDLGVQEKLGDVLAYISADYESQAASGQLYSLPAATPLRDEIVWGNGGDLVGVVVTAEAVEGQGDSLVSQLEAVGGRSIVAVGGRVSAVLPFAAIDDAAVLSALDYGDVTFEPVANTGYAVNQADIAFSADVARARFGLDGAGQRIGVISDSFNSLGGYAYDVSVGALPAGIEVLKEYPSVSQDGTPQLGSDEGRAMAQLVHQIAPAAEIFFATSGSGGPADFADSIRQLAAAGCTIIVDDITEAGVPWFQDGVVAQAVDEVVRGQGVTYLTSAGNFASNSYAAEYRPVAAASVPQLPAEIAEAGVISLHDFDPGPGVDVFQRVTIPAGTSELRLYMQWAQPWGENASDVDLYIYDSSGTVLLDRIDGSHQIGGNPSLGDSLDIPAGLEEVQVLIVNADGDSPGFFKYLTYHTTLTTEYSAGASTIVGHANSATAAAVGAASYFYTPAYREIPAQLAPYSSRGGTPILFDLDGTPLPEPEVRDQPKFVAPSFGNTTFFGDDVDLDTLPNFSGTSAAAPNAAAVAALLLQQSPQLPSEEVFSILGETARPMGDDASGFLTGAGLVQADAAVASVAAATIAGTVFEDFDRDGRQSEGERGLSDVTVFLDDNGNGQLDATAGPVSFAATSPVPFGTRELIDNPNTPSDGPLSKPAIAVSPVSVDGLPGVVTEVGVLMTITSNDVVDGYGVGPLFLTLVSPEGIRVPIAGTTVLGGTSDSPAYDPQPWLLPADGLPTTILFSNQSQLVSDFLPGTGLTRLSQVDLSAVEAVQPNGTWQMEVRNAGVRADLTGSLVSWQLFLGSAEPAVQTDSVGGYTFPGLVASSLAGVATPTVQLPAGRGLVSPVEPQALWLDAGESVAGIDFALTIPQSVPRPPLLPTAVLRVDRSVMGPQPVQFSWSELAAAVTSVPTGERFVVTQAVSGRVERWDGDAWVDVTQPSREAEPRGLLADLARRVIRPGDRLRWVPPAAAGATDVAFALLGWDGSLLSDDASDVIFEPAG